MYHNSLPSKSFFLESEIDEGDLDAETIAQFKSDVNNAAKKKAVTEALHKHSASETDAETAHGPVAKIKDFSAVKYQKDAYISYNAYYHPVSQEDYTKTYINGTLSCFCQDEFTKYGFATAFKWYRGDGYNQLPPKMLEMIDKNEAAKEEDPPMNKIC